MPTLYLLLRILTGLLLTAGLTVLVLIMLLHTVANFAKEGVGVIGYVVSLFTSGFTKGTAPDEARGWIASLPQIGLAIVFVSMLVSVFLPGAKVFLHVVAAMGIAALVWYLRMMLTEVQLEVLCLPFFPVWFVYYAISVFWKGDLVIRPAIQ